MEFVKELKFKRFPTENQQQKKKIKQELVSSSKNFNFLINLNNKPIQDENGKFTLKICLKYYYEVLLGDFEKDIKKQQADQIFKNFENLYFKTILIFMNQKQLKIYENLIAKKFEMIRDNQSFDF